MFTSTIPQDLLIEFTLTLLAEKNLDGSTKYSEEEVVKIINSIETLIKNGKLALKFNKE